VTMLHRDEIFSDKDKSGYLWCLHCERAYSRTDVREVDGQQLCHYANCDGDAVMDAWDWADIRRIHKDYPENPDPGAKYPLYADQ
jgi:hypothetical protein